MKCNICHNEMDEKFKVLTKSSSYEREYDEDTIYQCPVCKNVSIDL